MEGYNDGFADSLCLDVPRQTRKFLDQTSFETHSTPLRNASRKASLDILSTLLHMPQYTMIIATLFRPILLDLCARWLLEGTEILEKFEALCFLIEIHPELYPVLSTFLKMPIFERGPLPLLTASQTLDGVEARRMHRILVAYYRLLQANRTLPSILGWSLTPLSQLIWAPHPDKGVRFLAIRCYALQAGMMEGERTKIEKEALGEVSSVDCPVEFHTNYDGSVAEVDGWVFPVLELERITRARNERLESQNYCTIDETSEPIHPAELCPLIADVHGILLLRSSAPTQLSTSLIETPTTVQLLRKIALHLSMRVPILLTSAPSVGKSLLISHMAQLLFPNARNQIVTIHLADTSLDPRSLLGSYVSSPTRPGTFEWKEGVLVRAMRGGKWVVLEDVDRATAEVLGIIKPLVESLGADKWIGGRARLDVPSRGSIEAQDSFALFATRSLRPSPKGTIPSPTFFGAHKFYEIVVDSPSKRDLQTIIHTKFPRLAGTPVLGLINLWEALRALGSQVSTRDIGLRELEKFCTRVSGLLPATHQAMEVDADPALSPNLSLIFTNPALREDVFLEARDVFFGAGATTASGRAHLDAIAGVVAAHLGLAEENKNWLLYSRVEEFDLENDVNGQITGVRAGRTRLPACTNGKTRMAPAVSRPFAMHRPAMSLISRLASAISLAEPVLLTGETGTGKTSVVTHLASLLRRPLISLNLSNQTESSDILGGFKPVDARVPGGELQERFLELFGVSFSRKKNAHFEETVRKAVQERKWKRVAGLWKEAVRLAKDRIGAKQVEEDAKELEGGVSRKRRKVDETGLNVSMEAWLAFENDVQTFEVQHVQGKSKFAFAFVEGPLVKALRNGDWILLDEVNLATPETLESISSLLHGPTASITLTEQGSIEPIPRHPDFRLFACMNPATDVGKKDLPPNIRSRFTEIEVPPPDADKETLLTIVSQYIGAFAVGDKGAIMDVAEFHIAVKRLAEERQIADGANHKPHFSMRTLARALTFASDMAAAYSLRRALWEGCLMAFTMALDGPSATAVSALAQKHILASVKNPRSLLTKEPLPPKNQFAFVKFGPFYLERGQLPEDLAEDYIMTPSVENKLIDLARIIAAKRFPVLIEGPTSSGKTSSVEYLAKRTGHCFVRINNHEHTDIQEYIGTYVSDPMTGKLVFKEGLLVRALRQGDWIVLDELNLAPTDVLEALNRLLDDNRELVIPETQEVVRPHPHFMLFATQNPPGLYAGRKVLSRAFRNRFLEVHFEDVPRAELETILCQRCRIAPSYGQRIVSVFRELQKRRQSSRVFESKQGFATLRDLFRWAGRDAVGYEELAANGFMLLAERARREDDKTVVKEVIESVMKVRINESTLYDLHSPKFESCEFLGCPAPSSSQVVWTSAMQRLFVLIARALRFNEPVLLVGETGCGKTSVCQLYAEVLGRVLRTVNCHQNTETTDLIGGLRPIRNKAATEAETFREVASTLSRFGIGGNGTEDAASLTAAIDKLLKSTSLTAEQSSTLQDLRARLQRLSALFEWRDGPLVEAMRNGDVFLLDEISLADDSVLERLNSVLETGRTIVLAERGDSDAEIPAIKATENFKLVATMNPGGDYGKKELSLALRNRFTEIWVPAITDRRDLECIVQSLWQQEALRTQTQPLLDFVEWLCATVGDRSFANLRDILAWVAFSNATLRDKGVNSISPAEIFHHAAQMTFLDGLGSMPQLSAYSKDRLERLRAIAADKLQDLVPLSRPAQDEIAATTDPSAVQFGIFSIPRGPLPSSPHNFSLEAPTTRDNVMRVVRACQLLKPIMLEGSPGVGKTSLVAALANMCGHHLCRINLSDQTDLVDLFGSDLPVEGGEPGQFAWKDAEFLRALQEGHWVLLDEMNLAPQSVLEGLNAVLDHRGTVYIPELGRSFARHPSFRIFAAQNPLHQGGGRKGLPKSFLNRFSKVYVQEMTPSDLLLICRNLFPDYPADLLQKMIAYMAILNEETMIKRSFAREGAPWEFNLRDVIRWATLLQNANPPAHPSQYLSSVILQRFRTSEDRVRALELFKSLFQESIPVDNPSTVVSPSHLQIGHYHEYRGGQLSGVRSGRVLQASLLAMESLGTCIVNGWLAILTGPRNSGKTTLVRTMANLLGKTLRELPINNATDAADILGSFEETDLGYCLSEAIRDVRILLEEISCSEVGSRHHTSSDYTTLLQALSRTPTNVTDAFENLTQVLDSLGTLPPPYHGRCSLVRERLVHWSGRSSQASRLEWVDGPLVRAVKEGHWLLLDGANLCNPSVLDRLNSLCELDGSLALNERGAVNGEVQILHPHPDFRLFMSADGQYGELSRAMRNRGLEISLSFSPGEEDWRRILDHIGCSSTPASRDVDLRQLVAQTARLQRGLCDRPTSSQPVTLPASRLMEQDSSNTAIAALIPTLVSSSHLASIKRASLYFVATNVVPNSLHHLIRFLHSSPSLLPPFCSLVHKFLGVLECSHVYRTIVQMRRNVSQTLNFPPDALLAQPLYVEISRSKTTNESFWDEATTIRHLRLLVAASTDYGEPLEESLMPKMTHTNERLRAQVRAAACAGAAVRTIKETATAFLETTDFKTTNYDVDRMLELVALGRFLRASVQIVSTFDFSLALSVLGLVKQALQNVSAKSLFTAIVHSVDALEEVLSLTSGIGLTELWRTLSWDLPDECTNRLTELNNADRRLSNDRKLRMEILDVMAMWRLPKTSQEDQRRVLTALTSQLDKRLLEAHPPAENGMQETVDYVYLTAQLCALHAISIRAPDTPLILQELVEYGYSGQNITLTDLVPYRQIAWHLDVHEPVTKVQIESQKVWLAQLWDASSVMGINGPSALCHPVELASTILSCSDDTHRSMSILPQYALGLRRHLSFLSGRLSDSTGRWAQMISVLSGTTLTVASCLAPESSLVPQIPTTDLSHTLRILDNVHNTAFSAAYVKTLRSTLLALSEPSATSLYVLLGRCWIALSRLILDLYIPNIPVDPAMVQQASQMYRAEQGSLLNAELLLQQEHEKRATGRQDNPVIRYLSETLQDSDHHTSEDVSISSSRSDVVRLHAYWIEISQFLEQVISAPKVDDIVFALENQESHALMREHVIQESVAAFSQRLDGAYSDYMDVSGLIQVALLQLRLGLRLIADASSNGQASLPDEVMTMEALTTFPSVKGFRALQAVDISQSSSASISLVLFRLSAIASVASLSVELKSHMQQIDTIYEQALGLWLIDKARKEEADQQAESLYRNKTTEVNGPATEAELEEQDFLALFPEYEDLLEAVPSGAQTSSKSSYLIDPVHVKRLSILHRQLFGARSSLEGSDTGSSELRNSLVHDIVATRASCLPERLDPHSRPYQISLLLDRLNILDGAPRGSLNPYNFYTDPNVPEVQKSSQVLQRLATRLSALIEEWSDQMVLRHLRDRCHAISALDIFSPVAKVLSAIEQLLMQMEDWEMYANRENTLKVYQHELASLVISWRRLELTAWQGLLRTQAREFADGSADWWFQLYEATVRGVAAAAQDEEGGSAGALATYFEGLIPLLDSFMTSSPLGQFTARLHLLQAFESYCVQLSEIRTGSERTASLRAHRVLRFTRMYYSQFIPKVSASLSVQQQGLEKEIRNFIKLASWKDINVHALKQSAQKTHRQLYKCVRKLREVLRQPVTAHLVLGMAGSEESVSNTVTSDIHLSSDAPNFPPDPNPVSEHSANLERTFKKFQSIIQLRLGSVIKSLSSSDVEDLSAEIIGTQQSLASVSPPADLTAVQRGKFQKSLLVRKRKAFSDLLKELRRIGLATSVKPEVLEQHSSPRWIREQPVLAEVKHDLGPFEKSEVYLHRMAKLLPDLRAALSSHNPDIGTRDLQRGTSLVDSAFSIAIESRACFVEAASTYHRLQDAVSRLRMMSTSTRIVASGEKLRQHVVSIKEDIGKLVNALEETSTLWKQYLGQFPETEGLPSALDELQSALSTTQAMFGRMNDISVAIRLLDTPVLLEEEASIMQQSLDHVRTVTQLLTRWADGPTVVAHFARPLSEWLEQRESFALTQFEHVPRDTPSPDSAGELIDRLLLCIQGLLSLAPPPSSEADTPESTPDRFLRDHTRLIAQLTRTLKLDSVLALVSSLAASSPAHVSLREHLARVMPFLSAYLELARAQLANHCAWTKALFKLDYVVCSVMHTLARDGYCRAPDGDAGGHGALELEDAGGTGLGEGDAAGAENVSKDIEDESQVEGLQGDADADEDVERAEEGDALEMSEDFGGKMQDVPDDEGGEEGEEDDDKDEDAEPEEQVGDLDAEDPSAVDEKLWGDESGPEGSKEDGGKTAEDYSTKQQQEKESEMAAKEENGRQNKNRKEQADQEQPASEESKEGEEEAIPEDVVPDNEAGEDGEQDQQGGAPLDDFVQEANTLDLPDDMNFGKEDGKEPELDDDIEMDDEDGVEEERADDKEDMAQDAEEDAMDVEADNPQALPEDTTQPEGPMEDIVEGATAQPDLHAGAGQDSGETGDQPMADSNQGDGAQGPSSSGGATGPKDPVEREEAAQAGASQEEQIQEQNPDSPGRAQEPADEGKEGTGAARSQQGSAPTQPKPQPLQTNPLRSLGDAVREISQRINEILESEGAQHPPEPQRDASSTSQVEYLRPDEDQGAEEMQALGPAQQEDVAKLNDLRFLDENMDASDAVLPVEESSEPVPEDTSHPPRSTIHAEPTSQTLGDDVKSALTQTEIRAQLLGQSAPQQPDSSARLLPSDDTETDPDAAQAKVELALRQWQAAGQPEELAADLWRQYEALTHDLSYALCEQLRLILEPTRATRLRGDYRTGKRLNMKKIVPYVASEYTKDKIWLRRTRASTREYQVLLALDDSRSMAESHSAHLAFQTLALVARALGRLEVGDVAIAKFGEGVDVLHGFDGGPFTDQAGTRVMGAFTFAQKATRVLDLVETSLALLEHARERQAAGSASAADLWQLEIIISDGICQDHERLRTVLRRAEEQRVMIVFVILDSLHSKIAAGQGQGAAATAMTGKNENSILSMNQVAYKMVDGKMDLQVERYLDTFPFEYYVVLRDVEALPDVLTGTLKQFFERIAET